MRLAFLSTHLTGTGHFVRSLALARAAMRAGHEALLLNGGRPLPHIASTDVPQVQLPWLQVTGLDYATLRRACGAPASAQDRAARIMAIETALGRFAPDMLVTETYPLGRRNLRQEFEAALAATPAPAIASVRDIPEPKPHRLAEAAATLDRRYRALLVHGDAGFIPLAESWPLETARCKLLHTGYVTDPCPDAEESEAPPVEILVSTGGGQLGGELVRKAIEAAPLTPFHWHILTGLEIREPLPGNVTVEAPRADYRALLGRARLSVSLCGYNTAMDLALCTTPALLAPMTEGGEREQALRARAMTRFEGIELVPEGSPAKLAAQVRRMAGKRRPPLPITTDGAERSIELLERLTRCP